MCFVKTCTSVCTLATLGMQCFFYIRLVCTLLFATMDTLDESKMMVLD